MQVPEFIKCYCSNTDRDICATCPKEFVLPVGAIEGVYKDSDGKALILINKVHYVSHPLCGDLYRIVKTDMAYADVLTALDGEVVDLGNIKLTNEDKISRG